jgi:hypothetical protein
VQCQCVICRAAAATPAGDCSLLGRRQARRTPPTRYTSNRPATRLSPPPAMPLRCPDRHRARIGSWESARSPAATWRCRLSFAPRFDHHRRTVTLRRSYLYLVVVVLTLTNHPAAVTGAVMLVILAVRGCTPTALSPSRLARHRHRHRQPQPQRPATALCT